jgi:hypothetical protein
MFCDVVCMVSFINYNSNSVVEPLSTHIIPNYDHNSFNILIVLIAFYGFILLPQYVLNTNCEPEDDLK